MPATKKQSSPPKSDFVPFATPLPDGRTLFIRIPSHLVSRPRGGNLTFTAEGNRFLADIQAEAMAGPVVPSADRIKAMRAALELTQGELADRMGYSLVTVKKWESERLMPGKKAVLKLHQIAQEAIRQGITLPR